MENRLAQGTRVRTLKPVLPDKEWTPEALSARKWGVSGTVIDHSDSHGLCYYVWHDDKSMGYYDPDEIEVIKDESLWGKK